MNYARSGFFNYLVWPEREGEEREVITVCMIVYNKYRPVRFTTDSQLHDTNSHHGLNFICQNYTKPSLSF